MFCFFIYSPPEGAVGELHAGLPEGEDRPREGAGRPHPGAADWGQVCHGGGPDLPRLSL